MNLTRKSDSFPGPISEARAASSAGGGTALTTSAALVVIPDHATHVTLQPRNFSTAVVCRFAVNPYLVVLRSDSNLASGVTNYSVPAQSGAAGALTVFSALDTLTNGGVFYVGSTAPIRGLRVVIVGANANTAALTGKYWNGSAWTSLSVTDGTTTGGKTLAQNGDITWTVPTAWAAAYLNATRTPQAGVAPFIYGSDAVRYWAQFSVSAVLSATVTASSVLPLNRSTAYAELTENAVYAERVFKGVGGVSCLELLTDAGTANAIVNAFTDNPVTIF